MKEQEAKIPSNKEVILSLGGRMLNSNNRKWFQYRKRGCHRSIIGTDAGRDVTDVVVDPLVGPFQQKFLLSHEQEV